MARKTLNDLKRFLGIPEGAESSSVKVTPSQAKWILRNFNKGNRRINKSHVVALKKDMESGSWFLDSHYIGFSPDGILVDGQHRLKALSEAGVEHIILKFDFNVERHISMDTGLPRKYSDQVKISSKGGEELMPDSYRRIIMAGLKISGFNEPITNSEMYVLSGKYLPRMRKCDEAGLFDLGPNIGTVVKASIFYAYLCGVDINLLANFSAVLKSGITRADTDIPIIRLRDELRLLRGTSNEKNMRRARLTQQCIYNVTMGSTSNVLPRNPVLHYQDVDLMKG